jgi:hypothetical protein
VRGIIYALVIIGFLVYVREKDQELVLLAIELKKMEMACK